MITAKIKTFIKNETVFVISAVCAIATMFFVPPDKEYIEYIDFRVLCLLFCLMGVVAGFRNAGVFSTLTYQLLNRIKNGRLLSVTLVLLPFFSSMLVTNDVALIVFIPFTIALLNKSDGKKSVVPVIVMQTVSANLGSMATPIGNPQNLFLYSAYNLSFGDFAGVTVPLTVLSLVVLAVASLPLLPAKLTVDGIKKESIEDKKQPLVFIFLFAFSILSVFRILPYQVTTIITVILLLITNRGLFKEIDFMLLMTFVCFFIISENLGRLEFVRSFLQQLLEKSTLFASIGTSQIISNVPAAVLLSAFTDNWRELLAGVNIGGLGTPVASLASLITLKLYMKTDNSKILKFLITFTVANIAGLLILSAFSILF